MTRIELDYSPQERQRVLHESPAQLILYGGAAGGGKSAALRMGEAVAWALQVPGIKVYLFRRTLGELEGTHIVPLQEWLPGELYHYAESKKRFEFWNGSMIHCCYCEREKDVTRYQSEEMHVLLIDEASHLTDFQINYLLTRNRLGGFREKVPERYRVLLPRAVFASNPGGPGHTMLKQRFIEPAAPQQVFEDRWSKRLAQFIPAKMSDNDYLDDGYENAFNGLPPEMAQALKDGDWDSVVGAALHNLNRERHQLRPFKPPHWWTKFMAIDWGTAKPFSVGWYCVADGDAHLARKGHWPERYLPAGAVVRYREWYGWNGRSNQGSRMESQKVAKRIMRIEEEAGETMDFRVGDTGMWAQDDGPSVQERMFEATDGRFVMVQSKKNRQANYAEIVSRLAGTDQFMETGVEDTHPMFFCTADCVHFWRTMPMLTLDEYNPEKGPDTKLEDHIYDEVVYALRARPYALTEEDRMWQDHGDEIRAARGAIEDPYAV